MTSASKILPQGEKLSKQATTTTGTHPSCTDLKLICARPPCVILRLLDNMCCVDINELRSRTNDIFPEKSYTTQRDMAVVTTIQDHAHCVQLLRTWQRLYTIGTHRQVPALRGKQHFCFDYFNPQPQCTCHFKFVVASERSQFFWGAF